MSLHRRCAMAVGRCSGKGAIGNGSDSEGSSGKGGGNGGWQRKSIESDCSSKQWLAIDEGGEEGSGEGRLEAIVVGEKAEEAECCG
ncbi:hypothetical protein BHM03_00027487 [Ensete ventricosum]|nr:hypothetical protein BHM03_00027487 [Ensete ventricosum]